MIDSVAGNGGSRPVLYAAIADAVFSALFALIAWKNANPINALLRRLTGFYVSIVGAMSALILNYSILMSFHDVIVAFREIPVSDWIKLINEKNGSPEVIYHEYLLNTVIGWFWQFILTVVSMVATREIWRTRREFNLIDAGLVDFLEASARPSARDRPREMKPRQVCVAAVEVA